MCGRYFPTFSPSIFSPKGPGAFGCRQFLGDPSEEDPPVPIPNTVVKLLSPDGTARASVWESRTSPGLIQSLPVKGEAFFMLRAGLWLGPPVARGRALEDTKRCAVARRALSNTE